MYVAQHRIKVRQHKDFKREGNDIVLDLAVTIDEAVLGARIEVPTATGRVQLNIPKGTSSGTVFRSRGKGVRNVTTGATGDELVTVRIVLPEKIDDQLSYFMAECHQKHACDPRKLQGSGGVVATAGLPFPNLEL